MQRRFRQVDVFSAEPFLGNPVAVVLDADGLSTADMQTFARWTNLSETTFVLPPDVEGADYQVRIFTVTSELPFAGHPTLGTAHAWLEAGGTPRNSAEVIQQCAAGLVPLRRDDGLLSFGAPPLLKSGPVDDELVARIAGQLGIARAEIADSQWVDNGPGWVAVLLQSAETVRTMRPEVSGIELGVVGPYPAGSECAFEVRAFFSQGDSTAEDPVTGSLNASLGQWLTSTGRASPPYVASQGTVIGRRGRVHVSGDESGAIWVGGATVTRITGTVEI